MGLTTGNASARIVCNDEGACWHVQTEYDFPPTLGLTVHPDDWRWKEGERHAWREHEGRGHWKADKWDNF